LVGSALSRKLVAENPKHIIITSLKLSEAEDAVLKLEKEFPKKGRITLSHGAVIFFVRNEYKEMKQV